MTDGMDIFDALLPVYILSKILGLAPFYRSGQRGNRKFVSSVGIIILIRFIAVVGSMIYVAWLIDMLKLQFDLRGIALRCELYLGSVLTTVMLVHAVLKRKMVMSIVEDLSKIDKTMNAIGVKISYKNARRFAAFQIIGITCVFLSKAIIQPFASEQAFISIYNIFNVVDYINTITLFQYVDMLLLLRQRYIWFNRKLRLLSEYIIDESDADRKFQNKFDPVKPARNLRIYPNRNVNVNDIFNMDRNVALNFLAKIHNDLYDVGRKVNETYSLRLLVTVGVRVVMITTQLLTVYKMLYGKNKTNQNVKFILIGIYLFLHTSKVFMIASLSDNTSDKARQTGKFLHDIWKCNYAIRQKINNFSLQILQQDICFDCEGFFILDYTLIYNITAALSVYLVILIQFDSTGTTSVHTNSTTMSNFSTLLQ